VENVNYTVSPSQSIFCSVNKDYTS